MGFTQLRAWNDLNYCPESSDVGSLLFFRTRSTYICGIENEQVCWSVTCLLFVGILAGQEQRHDLYGTVLKSIGDNWDWRQKILAAHANFRIKVNMGFDITFTDVLLVQCVVVLLKRWYGGMIAMEWAEDISTWCDWPVPYFFIKHFIHLYYFLKHDLVIGCISLFVLEGGRYGCLHVLILGYV